MLDFDYSPELFSMHFILYQMHSGIPGRDERGIEMVSLLQMVNKRITTLLILPLLANYLLSCSFSQAVALNLQLLLTESTQVCGLITLPSAPTTDRKSAKPSSLPQKEKEALKFTAPT